jgi:4-amino-4-deoxy-L-arabinose transferase-like glycosyltransferase
MMRKDVFLEHIISIQNFINLHQNKLSLLIIILFSLSITCLSILKNSHVWSVAYNFHDTYLYLGYALRFSGVYINGYGFMNALSPLIPFLTSLIFRLGFVSELAIIFVTAIFYMVGAIGSYFLFRLYFKNLLAVFTSLMCFSLFVNLLWVATGTIDIPAMALSIWALYFTFLAVKKNQVYFYLAFPMLALSFLAKYVGAFTFLPMSLIIFSQWINTGTIKKYLKNIFGGLLLGCLTLLPYLLYIVINKFPMGFMSQTVEIANEGRKVISQGSDIFYYFRTLPTTIGDFPAYFYKFNIVVIFEVFLIAILIVGLIIGLIKFILFLKNSYNKSKRETLFKNRFFYNLTLKQATLFKDTLFKNRFFYNLTLKQVNLFKNRFFIKLTFKQAISIIIGTILISEFLFLIVANVSIVWTELLFILNIFIFTFILNKILIFYNMKTDKINYIIIMFLWFFSHILFFSSHNTKGVRYFIPMTPAFAFFIGLSIEFIGEGFAFLKEKLNYRILNFNFKKNLTIALIVSLLLFSFSTFSFNYPQDFNIYHASDMIEASTWLKNHDPHYKSKVIYSDRGEMLTWLLKKEVLLITYRSLKSPEKISNASKLMLKRDATYFVGVSNISFEGFHQLKKFNNVTIYERDI